MRGLESACLEGPRLATKDGVGNAGVHRSLCRERGFLKIHSLRVYGPAAGHGRWPHVNRRPQKMYLFFKNSGVLENQSVTCTDF